jgi:hypothetical protein
MFPGIGFVNQENLIIRIRQNELPEVTVQITGKAHFVIAIG